MLQNNRTHVIGHVVQFAILLHIINGMYVLNRCCIFFKVCVSFSDNYY